MSNYVNDTAAAKSVRAIVILNKKGEHVATVRASWSKGGTCLLNVHDDKAGFQYARAGGYGYDKFTKCLSGMTIDGHALTDHCGARLPLPKGEKVFPRDYKPRKGYSLANFAEISNATGNRITHDEWIKAAYLALGIADESDEVKNARWGDVALKVIELENAWRESDDCISGYRDCYRESGLDYLKALGYRIITAI